MHELVRIYLMMNNYTKEYMCPCQCVRGRNERDIRISNCFIDGVCVFEESNSAR